MAEPTYPILSLCATVGSKLSDLVLKDGQLIFVQDKHRIALDYNGKRVFYNQIEELYTEQDRTSLLSPTVGQYYFVIETGVLWTFQRGWIQITTPPDEIIFIGTSMPQLGNPKMLYVDKMSGQIRVWDAQSSSYIVVANKTDMEQITTKEINTLFSLVEQEK